MQVCKEWRSTGREAAKGLRIDCSRHGGDAEEHVLRLLRFFPYEDALHMRTEDQTTLGVYERVISSVDQKPVRIKHLTFSVYYPASPLRDIPDAILCCDWLESLALENAFVLGSMSGLGRWIHLKSLTLNYCNVIPPPSNQWTSLQVLKVDKLDMEELPDAVGRWRELRVLQLGRALGYNRTCSKLQGFPSSVGVWNKLEVLNLSGARSFHSSPPAVKTWSKLHELCLPSCPSIEALPTGVEAWHSLQTLSLENVGLLALPPSVGLWKSLQDLNLSCCARLSGLPSQVEGWERLRKIVLSSCSSFRSLPEAVGGWRELQDVIQSCDALQGLPKRWSELKSIKISHCGQLRHLSEEVQQWTSLEAVCLGNNKQIKGLLKEAPSDPVGETVSLNQM